MCGLPGTSSSVSSTPKVSWALPGFPFPQLWLETWAQPGWLYRTVLQLWPEASCLCLSVGLSVPWTPHFPISWFTPLLAKIYLPIASKEWTYGKYIFLIFSGPRMALVSTWLRDTSVENYLLEIIFFQNFEDIPLSSCILCHYCIF